MMLAGTHLYCDYIVNILDMVTERWFYNPSALYILTDWLFCEDHSPLRQTTERCGRFSVLRVDLNDGCTEGTGK